MSQEYDYEAAKQKIPVCIEAVENFITQIGEQKKERIREICKVVGSDKLTDDGEACCEAIDGIVDLIKQLCGVEGDKAEDGTLYGGLNAAKVMENVFN